MEWTETVVARLAEAKRAGVLPRGVFGCVAWPAAGARALGRVVAARGRDGGDRGAVAVGPSEPRGMSVRREPAERPGSFYATCERCGMWWCEDDEPVELMPGTWTVGGGPRAHACPEPMPYEQARMMADTARAVGGMVVSQRQRAAIRLGLEAGPR
jgi:hypothetical protein